MPHTSLFTSRDGKELYEKSIWSCAYSSSGHRMTSAVSAASPEEVEKDDITIVVNCCCEQGGGGLPAPKPTTNTNTNTNTNIVNVVFPNPMVVDKSKIHIHNNYHDKADIKIIKGNGNTVKNDNGSQKNNK